MKKINLYIEIVSSRDKSLSSMNKESRNSVLEVLSKKFTKVKITLVDTQEELENLADKNPDLVFLGTKFIVVDSKNADKKQQRIWLSEFFDQRSIHTTGSNKYAQQIEYNKERAKKIITNAGLKTAEFIYLKDGAKIKSSPKHPHFPLFVKPVDQGGGSGIDSDSYVSNITELNTKAKSIYDKYASDSIAEKYLSGKEYSVAILKNPEDDSYFLMPLELIAPLNNKQKRFLSGNIKKSDTETFRRVTDLATHKLVCDLAIGAFLAIGARDYGRIDIRLDSDGIPHFLEANLIPSLLKNYGNFLKACSLNNDIDYENAIYSIVNLALMRRSAELMDKIDEGVFPAPLPLVAG